MERRTTTLSALVYNPLLINILSMDYKNTIPYALSQFSVRVNFPRLLRENELIGIDLGRDLIDVNQVSIKIGIQIVKLSTNTNL
jgi:hypothetical protein